MKKLFAIAILTILSAVTSFADDGFACGVWFGTPKEVKDVSVSGLALGLPVISFKNLSGTSLSFCGCVSERTTGFQGTLLGFNNAQSMDGVQLACVNLLEKQHGDYALQIGGYNQSGKNGIQIGLINNARDNATLQFGLININRNGLIPVMIVVNFGKTFFD